MERIDTFCAAVFNLQQVLQCPKFNACMFYKTKLSVYNFTIYDLGTKKGDCFMWNEVIAARGLMR